MSSFDKVMSSCLSQTLFRLRRRKCHLGYHSVCQCVFEGLHEPDGELRFKCQRSRELTNILSTGIGLFAECGDFFRAPCVGVVLVEVLALVVIVEVVEVVEVVKVVDVVEVVEVVEKVIEVVEVIEVEVEVVVLVLVLEY